MDNEVSNPDLAMLAAKDAGLVGDDGAIQWAELRRLHPYLFRQSTPQGNAGTGTAKGAPDMERSPSSAMSNWIRNQALQKG